MARKGHTKVIYKGTFISEQSLSTCFDFYCVFYDSILVWTNFCEAYWFQFHSVHCWEFWQKPVNGAEKKLKTIVFWHIFMNKVCVGFLDFSETSL